MTRIASPMVREPVEIDARRMTGARRDRIIERDGRVCHYPECAETEGLQVDHIVALGLGGKDADHNLQLLCFEHHQMKSAADWKAIARAKRRKAKADGTFPETKAKIRGRGFQPTRDWREEP